MKELNQYIIEKFKISKNISSSDIDDIDIDFISYNNGVKDDTWKDFKSSYIIEYLKKLSKEPEFSNKINNIKKIKIKYWKEDNGKGTASIKYLVTLFLPGQEFTDSANWDSPKGQYLYKLVEKEKGLGNSPNVNVLIKYMLSELL